MSQSSKTSMFNSCEITEIEEALISMERDKSFNTGSSYSADSNLYPDNQMSFTRKHMAYLKSHPQLDPDHYLANLRLRIKTRK